MIKFGGVITGTMLTVQAEIQLLLEQIVMEIFRIAMIQRTIINFGGGGGGGDDLDHQFHSPNHTSRQ